MNERLKQWLTDQNIRRLKLRIERSISRYGYGAWGEDCAQEYFVHLLEGYGQHQTIGQFVIDYLRKRGGDARTIGFAKRRAFEFANSYEQGDFDRTVQSGVRLSVDDRLDFERVASGFRGRDEEIVRSYFGEGQTMTEIASEQGISESRVSQIIKNTKSAAKQAIDGKRVGMFGESLTKAEVGVARQLALGKANKEIADSLFVSEKTVKFHLTSIYSKLGIATRSEFVARYAGSGMFEATQETKSEGDEMADWQPMSDKKNVQLVNPMANLPQSPTSQEQVTFVLNAFKIDRTMNHLQTMSEEVTKGDYSVEKVMASCQCIGRMNETIGTVMKAAQVLKSGR